MVYITMLTILARYLRALNKRCRRGLFNPNLGFNIKKIFIRDIHAKFGIPNSHQSPNIGQNSDRGISGFWISDQIPFEKKFS